MDVPSMRTVWVTKACNKHPRIDCMHAYKKDHLTNTAIAPLKLTHDLSENQDR
jgi:hypothetical protein